MSRDKFAFWKAQAPMLVGVFCFLGFMNAKSAASAALFGMLATIAIAWQIRRQGSAVNQLGQPVMYLGAIYSEPPARMRPWYMLAVFAFGLMGLVTFLGVSDLSLHARLGMSLVSWAIVGAWLILLNRRLRVVGLIVMSGGFAVAGACMVWEAVRLLSAGEENAGLNAVRWSVFGGLLLLVGIGSLIGVLRNRGRTPIYESGVAGPHGYVTWENAERLEVHPLGDQPQLAIGAYNGWTLWIDVPADKRDAVADLLASKRPTSQDGSNGTDQDGAEHGSRP